MSSSLPLKIGAAVCLLAAAGYIARKAVRVVSLEYDEFASVAPPTDADPGAGLGGIEHVRWDLSDGSSQHALYVPPRNGALVILLHGSPGSARGFGDELGALARAGYGGLALDLPGYGHSEGDRRWDAAFRESVRRAVDHAVDVAGVEPGRVGVMGYSMGSAIAVQVAAQDMRVGALILQSAFTNLRDQLRYQFRSRIPGLAALAPLGARAWGVPVDTLDTLSSVAGLSTRPVLIVHGADDGAVPVTMAEALAGAIPRATLWTVEGVGHAGFDRLGEPYYERLREFWDWTLKPAPTAWQHSGHEDG